MQAWWILVVKSKNFRKTYVSAAEAKMSAGSLIYRQPRLRFINHIRPGPAVVPRIGRISSERGERLEGHHPAKAAEQGSLESNAGPVLIDGAGAIHEFGDRLATGKTFE